VLADTASDLPTDGTVAEGSTGVALDTGAEYTYDGAAWNALSGGGGGGAPTTADYLVKTADAGLSAERVVTDTSEIAWDWATAGQAKAGLVARGVAWAKVVAVTSARLLGRVTAGSGDAEELSLASGLKFTGSTLAPDFGSGVGKVTEGNDSRLSDARTPTAHATSHQHGGADEVATATAAANAIPKAGSGGTLDKAWLPTFVASGGSHAAGAVPDPGSTAGTKKFLREDATFKVPDTYSPILEVKASSDTPDDDFSSGSLAGKWTAVNGASGTVDLLEAGTTISRYDLSTRSGWLLVQVGKNSGQAVRLRQDYTLPDGNSIILAATIGMQGVSSGAGSTVNNSYQFGIGLNSTDGTLQSGTWNELMSDAQGGSSSRILITDASSTSDGSGDYTPGGLGYFRVARSGLTYYYFYSTTGVSWHPVGSRTVASAFDNLWLFFECNATFAAPVPVIAVDWIRLGSNALDPW
jgi:hypothetical protein